MTAAKYNSSLFFVPLYGTAARQTSVRHWYSSMLSNLTIVRTALFYCNRNHNLLWGGGEVLEIFTETKRKNISNA
jgi:hypothetical protein